MADRRVRNPLIPVVVGGVGLIAIMLGQSVPNRHSVEDDLRTRSASALEAAGIDADVRFVGRDGTVRVAAADGDRALEIVRSVEGVRVARVEVLDVVATPSPSSSPTPAATPTPTPAPSPSVQAQLGALPPVTFENNSATLTAQGQAVVANVADILKANPTIRVSIEGHTDTNGSAGSNLALSQARAQTVLNSLVSLGIAADRLTAAGYGESRPKVPDTSDENRAINRRVEFVVVR
jgi:outer membrane protein OmpA-like peptidoglycan-associated protein